MAMTWHDLLFMHWPVSAQALQSRLPAELNVDTYEGRAWIAVVPFHMSGVRVRWLPPLPGLSAFPELNVRTYVRVGDRPGVYFFTLDAANAIAVATARRFYRLNYVRARMRVECRDDWIHYESRRTRRGAGPAELVVRYRPAGPVYSARPGDLDRWLTERYCLYTFDGRGRIFAAEIHHAPWRLHVAQADIGRNTMTQALGIELPDMPPLLHYAQRLDVVAWPLRRV